jgi:hypothetical protein
MGEYYTNSPRRIPASSTSDKPYEARWYNRPYIYEDPWISLTDHDVAVGRGDILYGEHSFGNAHAANVLPIHDGADVFIRASGSDHGSANQPQCHGLFGGGWTRVRHVKAGRTWHPATDRLSGRDEYGTEGWEDSSWSVRFSPKVPNYDQFLFATGDCQKWLAADKDQVVGGYYTNSPRRILASSHRQFGPYQARWYNRRGVLEDPWISLIDHDVAVGRGDILYGEYSFGHAHAANVLPMHNGADVYIRASGSSHRSSNQLDEGGFKYLRGE